MIASRVSSSPMPRRAFLTRIVPAGAAAVAAACAARRSGAAGVPAVTRAAAPRPLALPPRAEPTGEIVVSFADSGGTLSPSVAKAVADVRRRHPAATIRVDAQKIPGGQYLTSLMLAIRAGDAPDVFNITGGAIGALVAAGAIAPLDDYVAAWPDWARYPRQVRQAVTYEGRVWAIPYGLDTHFLYCRRDVLARAGLPRDWQPARVADLLVAGQAIKQALPDVIPYALYAGQNAGNGTAVRGFVPLLWAYGGEFQDGAGRWIIDSCAIRDAMAFYERAFRTDKIVPSQVVTTPNTQSVMRQMFGRGEVAMLFDGCWAYGPWANADRQGAADNIGYGLFPTRDGPPSFTVGGPGTVWFVSAHSQHKDLAWEFLAAWNTAETVADLALRDPHPPARADAADALAAQGATFLVDATASLQHARYVPLNPSYQDLVGVLHDVTGSIATGRMGHDEAVAAYSANLTRILGADKVVKQPCP